MNTSSKYVLLLGITLILAACGPIYQTRYIYIPPESPQARQCLAQCELVRYQCEQMEKQRYEDCEDDRRREEELYRRELQFYERCKQLQQGNDTGCYRPVHFPGRYCSRDTQGCIELYNRCYETCGGQVESQQVCTYGCD